jgi:ubiquinone/menaquinone biosynthesis C-methylase UbiE
VRPLKKRLFRYRALERALVSARPDARVLDVGCGAGDNLARLRRYGGRPFGIDPSQDRVRSASTLCPAVVARGEQLPWRDGAFDLVYVSHVLHHASDLHAVLRECRRVLAPGGLLFVLESVDDSPLMRLARRVRPSWDEDDVTNRFRFTQLAMEMSRTGFRLEGGATFNWLYFAWEVLPLRFPALHRLTPAVLAVELALRPALDRFGGHCWFVASKPGKPLFPPPSALGEFSAASRYAPLARSAAVPPISATGSSDIER